MYEKYYDILELSGIGANIDHQTIEQLLCYLKPEEKKFAKGMLIRNEGTPICDCGLILDGEVMQTRTKCGGERAIFELLREGSFFGEVLMNLPNRSFWASDSIAKTNCTILFFEISSLKSLKNHDELCAQQLYQNFIIHLAQRYESMMVALRCFKTRTVRQRISTYLFEMIQLRGKTQFILHYNRDELADYLFLPRSSLSRELSKMKAEGIIDYYKSSIKITDYDALLGCL